MFPFTVAKAQRGVQVKVDTDRRTNNTISIVQKDQAAAIFETAGRRTDNSLERSLGQLAPGRTRIIGPAVYRARPEFEDELREMTDIESFASLRYTLMAAQNPMVMAYTNAGDSSSVVLNQFRDRALASIASSLFNFSLREKSSCLNFSFLLSEL